MSAADERTRRRYDGFVVGRPMRPHGGARLAGQVESPTRPVLAAKTEQGLPTPPRSQRKQVPGRVVPQPEVSIEQPPDERLRPGTLEATDGAGLRVCQLQDPYVVLLEREQLGVGARFHKARRQEQCRREWRRNPEKRVSPISSQPPADVPLRRHDHERLRRLAR